MFDQVEFKSDTWYSLFCISGHDSVGVGMGNGTGKQNQQAEFYSRKRKTLNSKPCMLLCQIHATNFTHDHQMKAGAGVNLG